MKLKNMSKEEIEAMSYTDLTYMLLKENKKPMNTAELFKKICELLELTEEDYSEQIGDFYTSLTIDKRFHMLESAEWDLMEKHKVELQIDDEDEEIESEEESEDEEETEDEQEENIDSLDSLDDELDDVDDDTLDLSIVTEEELEEEN
jgi:DNA-directed RNA polymerase subunit delta